MALHVLPILKALAPLVANAGSIAASLRASATAQLDDRVSKLERETIRAGEVLAGVAQQLQAIAEQLRVQAEQTEALARKAKLALVAAGIACGTAFVTFLVALVP